MKMKKHYKLIIGAILIFTSGLLVGGGIAYIITQKQGKREPLQKFKTELFDRMVKELKLTPEQQIEVKLLLDKGMERMKKFRLKHTPEILMIVKENHQDLKKILTPEQWMLYEGYRSEQLDKMQRSIPQI